MAVYSASKAFMLNFSDALSGENSVEIITASPSGTATNFQSASGVKKKKGEILLEPSFVASKIISQVGKGSKSIIIGRSGKIMALLSKILPRKTQIKLWKHMIKKMR